MDNLQRKELVSKLESKLNYKFKKLKLLEVALTHRSARKQCNNQDYEQLEFIGDAVLDLIIGHLLLEQYPDKKEGELSKMRAALVNTDSLAEISRELKLGDLIKMSSGELNSGGKEKNSILADVTEAVFGAIYFESGFNTCFTVAKRIFSNRTLTVSPNDPKTELQEKLHLLGFETPVYEMEGSTGPDHAPTFISVVKIDNQIRGRGEGASKKASEQLAAEEALKNIKNSSQHAK